MIIYKDINYKSSLKLHLEDLDIKDICRIIEGRKGKKIDKIER
jgi:hypothetical protein